MSFTSMLNRLHGQPESYEKKAQYRFGRTLGAGTYGIVREADGPAGKVAVKIILKKNIKGNEKMVYDELDMLQRLQHPNIVRFVDWFESKDKYYIVTELATGGELFDRICEQGRFTEKDASQTIKQVLKAVDYLHDRNVVHRDLKPENLLYLTRSPSSDLVLADFGIAKMLDNKDEVLTTMAGSFGYAAPEVMQKKGHGKPVDMWSMGVITYTLLCGYSPFRSENLQDLIEECTNQPPQFHVRYWKDVSDDAKDFILQLLQPNPANRADSKQALAHRWLTGETASDHNLLPEIKAYILKARLRRGIEMVKLANRISALRVQEEDAENSDVPSDAMHAADNSRLKAAEDAAAAAAASDSDAAEATPAPAASSSSDPAHHLSKTSKLLKGAIFQEVVMAKVREMKQLESDKTAEDAIVRAHSDSSPPGAAKKPQP